MKSLFKTILIIPILLFAVSASANITSVTLIPPASDTLSNGKSYYLAGKDYTFRILANDPEADARADWTNVTLNFPNGGQSCQINIATDAIVAETGVVVGTRTYVSSDHSFIEYQVTLRFRWDSAPFNAVSTNSIQATVTNSTPTAPNTLSTTRTFNFGVITQIAVMNFAQNGDAADGRVNPWHTAFNITGTIVYYIAGETLTTTVESLDSGEVTAVTLTRTGAGATVALPANTGTIDNPVFAIPANFFRGTGGSDAVPTTLGNHTWNMVTAMDTAGSPESSFNALGINCDKIEITSVTFVNGGGIDSPYYRSVNIPTTEIRVQARMQNSGGPMVGNTSLVVRDDLIPTHTYTVEIANGGTTGQVLIDPVPNLTQVPDINTQALTYEVFNVYGSAYDGDSGGSYGQNSTSRIRDTTAPHTINWDRNDPPGANSAPFTTDLSALNTSTAQTITLNWQPLTNAFPEQDFYTYRIYYSTNSAGPWTIIDRTTANYGLGGAADTYRLDLITTGSASITGLIPLTTYEYLISAVDIFGNEVVSPLPLNNTAPGNKISGSKATTASSIEITITDGITSYPDSTFNNCPDPVTTHKLRKTAIKVTADIITAGNVPDAAYLVLANNNTEVVTSGAKAQYGPGGAGTYDDIMDAGMTALRSEIAFTRESANRWIAFIPSSHPLITVGTTTRFIIRLRFQTGDSYIDHNSEADLTPPGSSVDEEWRFYISEEPTFTPWPVRILNNVITEKDPVAYPAYYLTDDALVTITAYDIKGRVVAILLDNAFRKAGQNIKEQGWRGTNKNNKKLGVGLYYIHIEAKRASDGKTIIDTFKKVVMAK